MSLPAASFSMTTLARMWLATLLLLAARAGAADFITLGTWNLEWLMTPATHAALRSSCTRAGQPNPPVRSIPCDVARQPIRTKADLARLRDYATRLDADVIAIQEVDGPAAAQQVFTDHDFCFTARRAVQNNGFAIRRGRGIRFNCESEYRALALGRGLLRSGAQLTLFPGTPRELHLLGVHLKSGCASQRLNKRDEACELLSRQAAPLLQWIDAQARAGRRFMLLGDFNRRLAQERGAARDAAGRLVKLWPELDRAELPGADLTSITEGRPYIKCHLSERHSAYIDHIVAGESAAQFWLPATFRRIAYAQSDAVQLRLSDHCPLAVQYRLAP